MKTAKSFIHFLFFYSWKISDVSLNIWCCSNTHGLQFFYVIRKTKKLRGSAQHGSPNVLVFNIDKTLQKNKPSHSRYVKYCFFFKLLSLNGNLGKMLADHFPFRKQLSENCCLFFNENGEKAKDFSWLRCLKESHLQTPRDDTTEWGGREKNSACKIQKIVLWIPICFLSCLQDQYDVSYSTSNQVTLSKWVVTDAAVQKVVQKESP